MIFGWGKKKKEITPITLPEQEAIEGLIKAFLSRNAPSLESDEIGEEDALFSSGILSSLAYIELVTFIEDQFQIRLSETSNVNVNTMDTVSRIVQTITNAAQQHNAQIETSA